MEQINPFVFAQIFDAYEVSESEFAQIKDASFAHAYVECLV